MMDTCPITGVLIRGKETDERERETWRRMPVTTEAEAELFSCKPINAKIASSTGS